MKAVMSLAGAGKASPVAPKPAGRDDLASLMYSSGTMGERRIHTMYICCASAYHRCTEVLVLHTSMRVSTSVWIRVLMLN